MISQRFSNEICNFASVFTTKIKNMETLNKEHILYVWGKGHHSADEYKKLTPEVYAAIQDYLTTRDHLNPDKPLNEQVDFRPCGMGTMYYGDLLPLAKKYDLPMTLENTEPQNAEAARLYLEQLEMKI